MSQLYDIFLHYGRRVTTDSRNIAPGALFFALRGATFDGNGFAVEALRCGAAVAVCDNPAVVEGQEGAADLIAQGRIVMVGDSLAALQALATEYRSHWGFPVLAVTGTNGKTTTKELVSAVLSVKYAVHATAGNLNNHIGVPLTILSTPADADFAVVEMGASACGEIAALCRMARPDYGIVTNIGRAHLEGFGGPEGVVRGKGELYDSLLAGGGKAFYNAADKVLAAMVAERPGLATLPFDSSLADGVETRLEGGYNRINMAAAMAIGGHFGIGREAAAQAIAGYVPGNNRSQPVQTARNRIIADCYNANPSSMAAAIESFGSAPTSRGKVAILGDMRELGKFSQDEHIAVLRRLAAAGVGEAMLVGPEFTAAAEVAGTSGVKVATFPDTAGLMAFLRQNPMEGREILLKGSRLVGLEKVMPLL